jgi:cytochrome P450
MAPVIYVPQLDAALINRRSDIFKQEKRVDLFSSCQPDGLMVQLMGENMMRKDGVEHQESRRKIFTSLSPWTVLEAWRAEFERSIPAVIEGFKKK